MPIPVQYRSFVIGLDMSLEGTGVAIIRGGHDVKIGEHCLTRHNVARMQTIKPSLTGPERLHSIKRTLLDLFAEVHPALVVIEGYAHGASFKAHALGEVGGVARLAMWEHHIPFVEIAPKQLKLYASGYGGSTKPQMRKAILQRWGVDIKDNNQVDAYALAQLGVIAMQKGPEGNRMSALEYEIARNLRYCTHGGNPPFPMLTRRM